MLINPQRILDTEDKKCMGHGLSFFNTLDNALTKYQKVCRKPSLKKVLGELVAEISLDEEDGVSADVIDKNYGHFTFHEYEETNLPNKIVTITEIFDEHGNYTR